MVVSRIRRLPSEVYHRRFEDQPAAGARNDWGGEWLVASGEEKTWAAFAADGGVGMEDPSPLLPSQKTVRASGVKGDVGMLQRGQELAGSEGVEGAETVVEFGDGEAALAVEPAEKIGGGKIGRAHV